MIESKHMSIFMHEHRLQIHVVRTTTHNGATDYKHHRSQTVYVHRVIGDVDLPYCRIGADKDCVRIEYCSPTGH